MKNLVKSEGGQDELELMRNDENITIKHIIRNIAIALTRLAVIKLPGKKYIKWNFQK